jgi:hypothetical protein
VKLGIVHPIKRKKVAVVSFANFDEMNEICWGMAEEEELLTKVKLTAERLEFMTDQIADTNRWWEEVAKEILTEKERELFHVR